MYNVISQYYMKHVNDKLFLIIYLLQQVLRIGSFFVLYIFTKMISNFFHLNYIYGTCTLYIVYTFNTAIRD